MEANLLIADTLRRVTTQVAETFQRLLKMIKDLTKRVNEHDEQIANLLEVQKELTNTLVAIADRLAADGMLQLPEFQKMMRNN